ncbi:multiple sugar transport system ATP-binding protein [Sphingomonas sp. UYAg733]
MADVRLTGASKSFGTTEVLLDIDLEIADGEFVVFVGPSGCGKSTLLRVIAGLEDVSAGEVSIGGRVVNNVAPADRGIAMVFQSYALYPHMNVRENLAFGLKLQRLPRAEIDAAVEAAAATLDIGHLLDRKPKQLSGGQRQRVAIGRAIVRQPQVFLFDEPLSNLDAALRVRMRYEFAGLHKTLGTTMIYVTHDQVEAMTLAGRIVVLSAGRIEQVGTPAELYAHPDTIFVAGFIGSPKMNLLPAVLTSNSPGGAVVRLAGGTEIHAAIDASRLAPGAAVTLGIRPEHFAIGGEVNRIEAVVRFVESLGSAHFGYLDLAGLDEPLTCALPERPAVDATIAVGLPIEHLYLFDAEGKALARPRAEAASAAA